MDLRNNSTTKSSMECKTTKLNDIPLSGEKVTHFDRYNMKYLISYLTFFCGDYFSTNLIFHYRIITVTIIIIWFEKFLTQKV